DSTAPQVRLAEALGNSLGIEGELAPVVAAIGRKLDLGTDLEFLPHYRDWLRLKSPRRLFAVVDASGQVFPASLRRAVRWTAFSIRVQWLDEGENPPRADFAVLLELILDTGKSWFQGLDSTDQVAPKVERITEEWL